MIYGVDSTEYAVETGTFYGVDLTDSRITENTVSVPYHGSRYNIRRLSFPGGLTETNDPNYFSVPEIVYGQGSTEKPRYRVKLGEDLYLSLWVVSVQASTGYREETTVKLQTTNALNNMAYEDSKNLTTVYASRLYEHFYCGLMTCTYNGVVYVGYGTKNTNNNTHSVSYGGYLYRYEDLRQFPNFSLELEEISEEYGKPSKEGGYNSLGKGGFDDSSDIIGIPNKPSLSVSSMGFINVYRPNPNTLNGMVNELFPTVDVPDLPTGDSLSDVVNAVNSLVDMIANGILQFGNKNLLDYVLDAHIIPVSPTVSTTDNIRVGYKTLSLTAPKVSDDYVDFNCGTISVAEYYGNYIDYQTKIKLYLPFVGFVPLLPEHLLDGKLNVYYRFNILDGSFCAWVLSTSSKSKLKDSVIGSFSGNCCVHIPISATNYSNVISGMVGGVSNMINSVAHESLSGAMKGTQEMLQTSKPEVSLSNGYNATSSYCGIRRPYLIIERPVASFSKGYPHDNGLPLNVYKKLSTITGKTIIEDFHTDTLTCSGQEKRMIKDAFIKGVVL